METSIKSYRKSEGHMKFSRIDEATIRCILTEADLKERDIVLEDFFRNKEKVQSFFEEIVEEAKKEVSYEATSGILAVQVMPLPENGLSIVFSENQEAEFDGLLKNIKNMVGDIQEKLPSGLEKQNITPPSRICVYRFASLTDVESFCAAIPNDKKIKSGLYKNQADGDFYLVIEKGRISAKLFNLVCEIALEFSTFITQSQTQLTYFKEHYKCIIEKNALSKMQKIVDD